MEVEPGTSCAVQCWCWCWCCEPVTLCDLSLCLPVLSSTPFFPSPSLLPYLPLPVFTTPFARCRREVSPTVHATTFAIHIPSRSRSQRPPTFLRVPAPSNPLQIPTLHTFPVDDLEKAPSSSIILIDATHHARTLHRQSTGTERQTLAPPTAAPVSVPVPDF